MNINKTLLSFALGLAIQACQAKTSPVVERYRQKMLEFIAVQKGDNQELEDRLTGELDTLFLEGTAEEKEAMLALKFETDD